jgi:hypothetical protein
VPDSEPEIAGPSGRHDKSFDELLNDLPAFAGTAEVKQADAGHVENGSVLDEEADLLAEVRAEFDTVAMDDIAAPDPEAMPDADDVLDLVDDVAGDEDEGGWMSTLLEGKGDDRSQ